MNVFEGLYGDGGAGPAALPMFAASHGLRFSTAGLSAGMGLSIAPLPNLAIETDAGIDTARAEEPGGRRRHRVASLLRPQMQFAQGQRGARGVGLGVGVERTGHARVRRSEQPLRAQRSWWFRNEISVLYAHQSGG